MLYDLRAAIINLTEYFECSLACNDQGIHSALV